MLFGLECAVRMAAPSVPVRRYTNQEQNQAQEMLSGLPAKRLDRLTREGNAPNVDILLANRGSSVSKRRRRRAVLKR